MKNTALLIDTNVILNYLTGRSDQYLDSSIKNVRRWRTISTKGRSNDLPLPLSGDFFANSLFLIPQAEYRQADCHGYDDVHCTHGEYLCGAEAGGDILHHVRNKVSVGDGFVSRIRHEYYRFTYCHRNCRETCHGRDGEYY